MKKTTEIWQYIKWGGDFLITRLLGALTSWLVYPFSYVLRNHVRKFHYWYKEQSNWLKIVLLPIKIVDFFFWMYLNDGASKDYGYEFFWNHIGRYPNGKFWNDFVISYRWSGIRNYTWNLYSIFKCKHGKKEIIKVFYSECPNRDVKPEERRSIRFYYAEGKSDNEGDYLDYKTSVLGRNKVFYRVQDKIYFTIGSAGIKYIKWLNVLYHWERRIGYTDNHGDFRFKNKFKKVTERALNEYWYYKRS